MRVSVDTNNFGELLPIFFGILVGLMIIILLAYAFVKNKDNSKPLETRKVKVLEKPVQQGNVEWYVLECENGERLKLRSFQANSMFIAVGDVGTITYRGLTIQSFTRQS